MPKNPGEVTQHQIGSQTLQNIQQTEPSAFIHTNRSPKSHQPNFHLVKVGLLYPWLYSLHFFFRKAELMLLASVFKLTHEGLAEARMWWEMTEEEKDGLPPIHGVLPQGLPSTRHGAVSVRGVDGWLHPHSAWQMVTVFLSLLACMLGFLPPHFKMSPSPLAFPATCFYLCNSLNILQTPLSWQCIFSRFQEVPALIPLFNGALSNVIFVIIIFFFSGWVRNTGHILNSIFLFHLTDLAPVADHILLVCTFYACKINN